MKAWLVKHPVKRISFGLTILVLAPLVIRAALNYSGMCIDEKRYVTDKEKIHTAVKAILNYPSVTVQTLKADGTVHRATYPQIPYKNIDEFLSKNPECCQINPPVADNYFPPPFYKRISGMNADVVGISYIAKYKDGAGNEQSERIERYVYTYNCGRVRLGMWH